MTLNPPRRWTLTPQALDGLLQRLAPVPEAAAHEYMLLRRKVQGFFERRGIQDADTLTDETLDRVARRLEEGEAVDRLGAYVYGVARLVALEWHRRRALERPVLDHPARDTRATPEAAEKRVACLERCLDELPLESRGLIQRYHLCRLDERRQLALTLGISYNNLKTRAHRIRGTLLACLEKCLEDAVQA